MKIFKVTDKYSIAQFDDKNWVIQRQKAIRADKRKNSSPTGKEVAKTGIVGYYRTLERAKEALADIVSTEVGNYTELSKWIDKIKEV